MATGAAQAIYYLSLGAAYRRTEVSVAYPVARSLPLILVPLIAGIFSLGKPLHAMAASGMVLCALGCFILPFPSFARMKPRLFLNKGYLFILLAALGTSSYMIIDSEALRLLRAEALGLGRARLALFYLGLELVSIQAFLLAFALIRRRGREDLRALAGSGWRLPALCGIATTASYALILVAMGYATNVGYVMALRQMGIPLSVLLGILIFHERAGGFKPAGVTLILAGLAFVILG